MGMPGNSLLIHCYSLFFSRNLQILGRIHRVKKKFTVYFPVIGKRSCWLLATSCLLTAKATAGKPRVKLTVAARVSIRVETPGFWRLEARQPVMVYRNEAAKQRERKPES
jgi:hypothetical protein